MSNKIDRIKQGDVYWVDYLAPGFDIRKTRPCVVVSATIYNKPGADVIVCLLSSSITRTDLPCNVYVGEPVDGPSWCKTNQVCTVMADELTEERRCGELEPFYMEWVIELIARQIGANSTIDPGELEREAEREACVLGDYGVDDDAATYPAEG